MRNIIPFGLNLTDSSTSVSFPSNRSSLIAFVKEDCPTCREVMPVLAAISATCSDQIDCLVIGQDTDGNRILQAKHGVALLDDSTLKVSFAWDIETVPTLIRVDSRGRAQAELIGFVRDEWQALATELMGGDASLDGRIDWSKLPAWRPGCGSKSADPLIADRLRAESENSPLRARRIEIGQHDDEFEFMFDQGFSDGLPLIPPTPERVIRMLSGTSRDPQDVVAEVPPNMGVATVEKVAVNAVMAGCRPEYFPVVLAAVEAVCNEQYNIHGVMATTMGASPVLVINGPIRHRIGMNMKLGALGQGNRANATIGRAVRLAVRNIGGARPGGTERSTLGNPMKFTMCFAEWEERSPWEPLHVERGFRAEESVVTAYTASSGPVLMVDQDSRTAAQLAGSFGLALESIFGIKQHYATDTLLVIVPEHVDTINRDGWTKADIRKRIQEVSSRPVSELLANETSATGFKAAFAEGKSAEDLARLIPKFRREEDILIVVAGSEAGKFSGAFHGWATGAIGSVPVSRPIDPWM